MRKAKLLRIGFSLLTILLTNLVCSAQNSIAVQNNSNPRFYSNLVTALDSSINGDTIYIPGGNFALPYTYLPFSYSYKLQKKVHLIGAGHNTDSTQATGITYITGYLIFLGLDTSGNTSSGSSITGIYFSNGIAFSGGNWNFMDVDNITVSRCNIGSVWGNFDGSGWGACCGCVDNTYTDNFLFAQNVIRGSIIGISGASNVFTNNIIEGSFLSTGGSTIRNNIFLMQGNCPSSCSSPIRGIQNDVVENNIFITPSFTLTSYNGCNTYNIANSNFNKNLFVENIASPYCSSCLESGNYVGVPVSNIFQNQSGNIFSYSQDYHLQNPSVYVGTDGTQVGIYGGMLPWKDGSVPFNPHIQLENISGSTNQNGNLPINIKVAAQEH